MNTQYTRKSPLLLMAAASLMVGAVSAVEAAPIGVTVNGTSVSFGGTEPKEVSGSVLVPLRGVFEAMGASVDYDVYARTINAKRGASTIVLPVGSTSATVNGQTQTLSQPAQVVNGTTLVPLRFVAQALGAYVDWHAATSTVEIRTGGTQAENPTPVPTTDNSASLSGDLTGVYTNTVPARISVRVDGQDEFVPLTKNVVILLKRDGGAEREVELSSLFSGMSVVVTRRADGAATRIRSAFSSFHATVRSKGHLTSGNRVLTFDNGVTLEIAPEAIFKNQGSAISFDTLKAGDKVAVAYNPTSNLAYSVSMLPR